MIHQCIMSAPLFHGRHYLKIPRAPSANLLVMFKCANGRCYQDFLLQAFLHRLAWASLDKHFYSIPHIYFLLIRIQKLINLSRTVMLQHAKCGHSHHNKQGQKCTAAKHGLHRVLNHKGHLSGHIYVNRLLGSARVNNHSRYSVIRYILI